MNCFQESTTRNQRDPRTVKEGSAGEGILFLLLTYHKLQKAANRIDFGSQRSVHIAGELLTDETGN